MLPDKVHDEVLLEGPKHNAEAALRQVAILAADPLGFGTANPLNFRVEGGIGPTWATAGKGDIVAVQQRHVHEDADGGSVEDNALDLASVGDEDDTHGNHGALQGAT